MATVFYVVGTVVLLAGLAAIGLGTPASALDFGNTLLMIGTTASVGGLLLIALGAVVAQLQRIAENLAFEAERHAQPAFKPAPPEPLPRAQVKSELPPFEPQPFEPRPIHVRNCARYSRRSACELSPRLRLPGSSRP